MGLDNNNPVVLTVVTSGASFDRSFSVKVSQIECNSLSKGNPGPALQPAAAVMEATQIDISIGHSYQDLDFIQLKLTTVHNADNKWIFHNHFYIYIVTVDMNREIILIKCL